MMNYNQDAETKDLGGGVTRKILTHSPALMVCELTFEKGAVGALHKHPHEQIGYIVSGKLEVTEDGVTKILGTGDTYHSPGNTEHGVVALEETKLIDIFTPRRDDFLM